MNNTVYKCSDNFNCNKNYKETIKRNHMDIIAEAFSQLYPDKSFRHITTVKYSNRFNDFNANVRYTTNNLIFNFSKKWKTVDRDIKIGLIQDLLNKVFKTKIRTNNIDLYHIFIKKLHLTIPKTKTDPILEAAFAKLNEQFFHSTLEQPNLQWGTASIRKLGSYDYQSDLITISTVLQNNQELLEYIMHHEMLHKKLKFSHSGRHHTPEFKRLEKAYPNQKVLENKLKYLTTKKRVQKMFWPF